MTFKYLFQILIFFFITNWIIIARNVYLGKYKNISNRVKLQFVIFMIISIVISLLQFN